MDQELIAFLDTRFREVSQQTTVLHLQGFLFFGTIMRVEETIHSLVTESAWVRAPVRFLVLDFALVLGVDLSAAEAFVRGVERRID